MKRTFLLTLVLLSALIVFAQKEDNNLRYIQVLGSARMELKPDRIILEVVLDEEKTKKHRTISELQDKMVKQLVDAGIDINKSLQVKNLYSNYKSYIFSKDKIYIAKEFRIILSDGKAVEKVLEALEDIGISNIRLSKVENSKIEEYKRKLVVNAVVDAKTKAAMMASAIGQRIGKVISIVEHNNGGIYEQPRSLAMVDRTSNVYVTKEKKGFSPEFLKIKLRTNVTCRFDVE